MAMVQRQQSDRSQLERRKPKIKRTKIMQKKTGIHGYGHGRGHYRLVAFFVNYVFTMRISIKFINAARDLLLRRKVPTPQLTGTSFLSISWSNEDG